MDNNRRLEILGILTLALSVFFLISIFGYNSSEEPTLSPNIKPENPMGFFGIFVAHYLIKQWFGFASIIIPFLGLAWGWFLFSKKSLDELIRTTFYSIGSMVFLSLTAGVFIIEFTEKSWLISGQVGGVLAKLFLDMLSIWGVLIFLIAGLLMILRGYFDLDYYQPFVVLNKKWKDWRSAEILKNSESDKENIKRLHTQDLKAKIDAQKEKEELESEIQEVQETKSPAEENNNENFEKKEQVVEVDNLKESTTEITESEDLKLKLEDSEDKSSQEKSDIISQDEIDDESLNIEEVIETEEVDIDEVVERKKPKRKYQLPSSELLATPVTISDNLSRDELVERANYLTQSMATFGVEGKVVNVHPGPVITLFEVEPAEGVRVNKFVQLADDLARVMEASSVRVIAPIPGKSSVGIEIPNRNPATVFFKSVVNSPEFAEASSMLTLAIGKTTSGEISTLDLSKMPHLLIAGTTGSGKSVCINTIICSILYRATPDEVKFVMIDPKKVEMTLYKQLEGYHLLKMEDISEPIVTSVDHSILALRALEKEMDRRYTVLADVVVRNIGEYNEKMKKSDESIMPYIVLVVDELADLMMLSAKDVEAPIARLAQLSRAVGIHLVIATQRPSVDVITGVIKANFPSRIAFQVASKIDSRTIIDQPGADKLIGRGDMLHLGTGSSDVFRMHNAFLTLEEIESVMNHVSQQPKPDEVILPSVRETQLSDYGEGGQAGKDELFNEAVALVITHQQGSISLLQRRLKVGYSRAARLIDDMEQTGVVGPFTGSKAREVLVDETYLEMIRDS